jgi:hypothetical protein
MVVIVDDLDRLRSEEVREIFKLIRLTGNFPNVVYLVAFDRRQVESALGDEGIDGRAYLEKILQIAYEVPPVPQESLRRLFLEGLQEVVDPIETGPFDETLWPDVLVECIWPYVGNLRDAKRYLAGLPLTLRHIGDHVALVDVMAVEALRVFAPEAYRLLPATAEALTQPSDVGYGAQTDRGYQSKVEAFVGAAGENDEAVRSLCKRVFPASEKYLGGSNYGSDWLPRWMREQRIAHPDLLGFYIDRTLTKGMLATRQAERALAVLNDEGALRLIFADLSPDEIESTIAALEAYEPDYPPEAVEPACRVLIDLMPGLRTESRGMFDFGAELVVRRVVLRLLRRLDSSQVLGVTQNLFESIDTFHGRFGLVTIVGHRENAGHKLISHEEARILEDRLREEIAGASAQDLADERDLLKLLWWCMHPEDGPVPSVRAMDSPQLQDT